MEDGYLPGLPQRRPAKHECSAVCAVFVRSASRPASPRRRRDPSLSDVAQIEHFLQARPVDARVVDDLPVRLEAHDASDR